MGAAPPFSFWQRQKENAACPVEEKKRFGGSTCASADLLPPAGGWLALPRRSQGRKRVTLGGNFWPGKSGIHSAPLFAAAGCLVRELVKRADEGIGPYGDAEDFRSCVVQATTTARAARSEAERAERGTGQMRPCSPMTSAPAPRESAIKPVPHHAAPVGRPSRTRRHHLTPTSVQKLCMHVQSCDQSGLFFWTVHGPFSFPQDGKENGGCICPAISMAVSPVQTGALLNTLYGSAVPTAACCSPECGRTRPPRRSR